MTHFHVRLCVCVKHLNRCKTVKLLHDRGTGHCDWPSSTKLGHRVGYLDWPSRRTCNFPFRCQWQPAKPRTGVSWRVVFKEFFKPNFWTFICCHFVDYCWLYGFRSLPRWERFGLVDREGSTSNLLHLALAMAMVPSWFFLGSFHRPIPVRCSWNVFARGMHSTSEFAMIVLSKSVCVCTICIDVKLHYIAGACGTHVLPQAMKLWTWVGWEKWPVSCTCSFIYIYI